jgi:hypothetical protein
VFRAGDLRALLGTTARNDAVLLLGVGPVSGDHERTVAGMRTLVRPGGYLVIEDAYLADGVVSLPGYEGCAGRAETLRRLTTRGDELVLERVSPAETTRATNERNTALIRRRARRLKEHRPDLARGIDDYVARQERETELLGNEAVCAIWVLRSRAATLRRPSDAVE